MLAIGITLLSLAVVTVIVMMQQSPSLEGQIIGGTPATPHVSTVEPPVLITNPNTGLITYENKAYGFAFDYPIDWQVSRFTGASPEKLIDVESAESARQQGTFGVGNARTGFSVEVSGISPYLDPNTLQVVAPTARDYAAVERNTMSELGLGTDLPITQNFVNDTSTELITNNETNAWRLDYITNIQGAQAAYFFNVFIVKDNQVLYKLSFFTQPLKVPEMLPVGEKIIKSFRFI